MTKPVFDKEYECGAQGVVDWVAGGNFDGYIFKKSLTFKETSNEVLLKTSIIEQTRYDGQKSNTELIGNYQLTDKDTITVTCNNLKMRGKIIGTRNEYIVFSILLEDRASQITEVYKLE